jgi:hypothetical protein
MPSWTRPHDTLQKAPALVATVSPAVACDAGGIAARVSPHRHPAAPAMTHAFVFVCQAGELEVKSALLAASLRRHLPMSTPLVACVPQPTTDWGTPTVETARFLASLDVAIAPIASPFGSDYPIGNKIPCVDVVVPAERIVFLDSDILLLDTFAPARHLAGPFTAKPADISTSFPGAPADWHRGYAMCGVPAPLRRVFATVSGDVMWPYFNAGVVGVPAGSGFGAAWAACARAIDADTSFPGRRPHLDQIALPIAAAREGLRFTALPEAFNFPAHAKPLPASAPAICHYHWPTVVAGEPRLLAAVADLVRRHGPLTDLLDREPAWQPIATAVRAPRTTVRSAAAPPPAATGGAGLITGIPRSGTSLLCRLLDDLPDQVVLNEPAEIFSALDRAPRPWGMPILYRDWRRRILAREPIENKVVAGRIVDDTAVTDVRVPHVADVAAAEFVLWTKNTLAYAARLPQLADVMPEAAVVACVRHPFDTIASWIGTFSHLRDADVDRFPLGGPADILLTEQQRRDLAAIGACADPPRRRALLWRHLAGMLLARRRDLHIVRYEDLTADPSGQLARILGPGFRPPADGVLPTLAPRSRRDTLSAADIEAIADACIEPAAALGYDLHIDAVAALERRGVQA